MAGADAHQKLQPLHVGMLFRYFLCHERLPRPDWNAERTYTEWKGHLVSCMFNIFTQTRLDTDYCLEVFPFPAHDGSARQQLRFTHLQDTKLCDPKNIQFWSSNVLNSATSMEPWTLQTMCGDDTGYCPKCIPPHGLPLTQGLLEGCVLDLSSKTSRLVSSGCSDTAD